MKSTATQHIAWKRAAREKKLGMPLTPAERDALTKLAHGSMAKGIARTRGTSVRTVEAQVNNIRAKLGVHNVAHAVAVAVHRGLIEFEDAI